MKKPHRNDAYQNAILNGMNQTIGRTSTETTWGKPMYEGTVSADAVKQRRIKAKAAKQARKVQRRSGKRGR